MGCTGWWSCGSTGTVAHVENPPEAPWCVLPVLIRDLSVSRRLMWPVFTLSFLGSALEWLEWWLIKGTQSLFGLLHNAPEGLVGRLEKKLGLCTEWHHPCCVNDAILESSPMWEELVCGPAWRWAVYQYRLCCTKLGVVLVCFEFFLVILKILP